MKPVEARISDLTEEITRLRRRNEIALIALFATVLAFSIIDCLPIWTP